MLILALLVVLAVGGVLGFMVKQRLSRKKLESCENLSARIIDEAKKEAENIKKEAILQAKENLLKVKTEFEKDTRDTKERTRRPGTKAPVQRGKPRTENRSSVPKGNRHRKP